MILSFFSVFSSLPFFLYVIVFFSHPFERITMAKNCVVSGIFCEWHLHLVFYLRCETRESYLPNAFRVQLVSLVK